MSESKHTPGPWKADLRTGCFAIYAGPHRNCLAGVEDEVIVYQGGRGEESAPGSYRLLTNEQRANAAFIVRACKAHDDLVEAIKRLLPYAEIIAQEDSERALRARVAIRDARAAIARAEA